MDDQKVSGLVADEIKMVLVALQDIDNRVQYLRDQLDTILTSREPVAAYLANLQQLTGGTPLTALAETTTVAVVA